MLNIANAHRALCLPARPRFRARRLFHLFSIVALFASVGVPAFAQSGGGGITGVVADNTGAVIPKATVTALNVATGVSTVRTASSDGNYVLNPLQPGTYTVTATASGFASFKQENVVVDALSSVGLNITLKAGSQNEVVTVSAAPPMLQTTDSTMGGTIENSTAAHQWQPTAGRDTVLKSAARCAGESRWPVLHHSRHRPASG